LSLFFSLKINKNSMTKLIISFNALLLSLLAFFGSTESKPKSASYMPMCSSTMQDGGIPTWANTANFAALKSVKTTPSVFQADSTKAYSMPLLSQTPKGEVLLSWTEKDEKGVTSFCLAFSTDKGKTFSDKKVIYSGTGVSNSRLMRAKVLAKKDGSLVAVFSNRADAPAATASTQQGGGGGRGGGRSLELVYCLSKDGGTTWTSPQSVDSDPTKGIVRGFFDAAVMSNDEVAVVYLKDVANSTKHEERDLRLVTTKNGVFQPERVIDPVVCDCCNINLLIDANGALNVYYRDNNDDIRDIANMTSKDNGATFSKPQIVHNDGWKIAGCPHSGAISSTHGKSALVAWYSGAQTESGIRLVTQEGKKLFVLNDPSVKNPTLMSSSQVSAMLWEQNQAGDTKTQLVFRKINGDKVSETLSVEGSTNATNSTGLVIGNQLLFAHEVKQDKRNGLKIGTTVL
jgi:BNR repeat-like domain